MKNWQKVAILALVFLLIYIGLLIFKVTSLHINYFIILFVIALFTWYFIDKVQFKKNDVSSILKFTNFTVIKLVFAALLVLLLSLIMSRDKRLPFLLYSLSVYVGYLVLEVNEVIKKLK